MTSFELTNVNVKSQIKTLGKKFLIFFTKDIMPNRQSLAKLDHTVDSPHVALRLVGNVDFDNAVVVVGQSLEKSGKGVRRQAVGLEVE